MDNLSDFAFREEYKRYAKLGDRLAEVDALIDWEAFRPIVADMFDNTSVKGGRPNIDEVIMIKMLVLQAWHGLSDPELERQVMDRISFRKFLGFPDTVPDCTTVWFFRERLLKAGKDKEIWRELDRQLDAKGLRVRKGVIQDATFITADPGHAKVDEPRGDGAKTRRSKDGTWTKKGKKSEFGYKMHTKSDTSYELIREYKVTTASVHDSQVDLSKPGEVMRRDRGYQGAPCKGYNATMKRGARGHPIGIRDKMRNLRICRKRAPGERPYAVIKRVFGSGHMLVTTVARVAVKMMFACFSFNLYQLHALKRVEAI
jgi:IS5 family transposase